MKIVILSESFLKNKHLDRLRKIGEVEVFENTNSEDLAISRLRGAEIAITDCFVTPMSNSFFERLTSVKYICINSTGFDPIDINGAEKKGILISNVPDYSSEAVAELAISLMFTTLRRIVELDSLVRDGVFGLDINGKTIQKYHSFNIKNKTFGIIGLGKIGEHAANLANGLGMNVIAFNRSQKKVPNVKLVTLTELLKESDIISIHTPLNDDTRGLINYEAFSLMKNSALIINTARSKIIDEEALINALKEKRIAGAGLDVVSVKNKKNQLLRMKNVVLTPHIGWYTKESLENLAEIIIDNIEHYINGEAQHLITARD